jgi:hypothetical protein
MGFRSALTAIFNGPYRYREGPATLGVGVENLALVVPGPAPAMDFHSPRYDPRRSIDVAASTYAQTDVISLPFYDLRQRGLFLTGGIDLSGLIEMEKQNG